MHQVCCGNGFLILEKEGLEGVDIVCKPLIFVEHATCFAESDSGLCLSLFTPMHWGCGDWDGGALKPRVYFCSPVRGCGQGSAGIMCFPTKHLGSVGVLGQPEG